MGMISFCSKNAIIFLTAFSVNAANSVNSNVDILCGAGIMNDDDVKIALKLGSKGILIASGVVKSNNWGQKIKELVSAFI